MEKTKVKEFSACRIEDVNSLLGELGVTYVDLKVIQGRRRVDASLLLIYNEDDTSPSPIKKLKKMVTEFGGPPRMRDIFEYIKNTPALENIGLPTAG